MLVLFRFLAKYDLSYDVLYDDLGRPWSDKPLEFVLERARKGMDYLLAQGVDKIIVPSVVEVALYQDKKYGQHIVPLWMSYVSQECLPASPVGKIGFAGEYVDMTSHALFESFVQTYQLNETQLKRVSDIAAKKPGYTRKLSFRRHEITMRKYYLTKLSFKSQIVHHAMKADRRYFKDALVDTIIPTSYGFFAYETILGKFLNNNKQKFHRLAAVEKQFDSLMKSCELGDPRGTYGVHIFYTGTLDHLTREKKRMRMLQRGKEITVDIQHITL